MDVGPTTISGFLITVSCGNSADEATMGTIPAAGTIFCELPATEEDDSLGEFSIRSPVRKPEGENGEDSNKGDDDEEAEASDMGSDLGSDYNINGVADFRLGEDVDLASLAETLTGGGELRYAN
jgi:hypothetical protein